MAVRWSPDGEILAVSAGSSIFLYQTSDWKILAELPIGALTHGLAFSPDGQLLAAGSRDGNLRIWNIELAIQHPLDPPLFLLDAHRKSVNDLEFSSDGKILASGGNDAIARFWNPLTGEQTGMAIGGSFAVPSIAFSPDSAFLAIVNGDLVRMRQPGSERIMGSFKSDQPLFHVLVSTDGQFVTATGSDNRILIWPVIDAFRTGRAVFPEPVVLEGHHGKKGSYEALVWDIAYSPDGRKLASVGGDGRVILWDLLAQKVLDSQMAHPHGATCVDFHPDGEILSTGGLDGSVKIWN